MELKDIFKSELLAQDQISGYKSPIEIIQGEWEPKIENDVVRATQSYGIYVDKEELIKALNYDREQYKAGYRAALEEISRYINTWKEGTSPWEYKNPVLLKVTDDYIDLRLQQLFESDGEK